MAAAASVLARPPLYGIGTLRVGKEITDFDIGWDDFERDIDWAKRILTDSGIAAGDLVLVTSPNWESPWVSPVVHALRRMKAVYLTAEQFSWDARRVATILQRLPVRAFVGLGAATLEGLKATGGGAAELLGGVDILWARHDALPIVPSLGLSAVPFVPLGPALAMGIPEGRGALVNDAEWTVGGQNTELVVSTASARATRFDSLPTGLHGTVGPTTSQGRVVEFNLPGKG